MKTRFSLLVSLFFALFLFSPAYSSDWTILVFVQANNNLKNFAQRNFTDMATIGSTPDLNILIQCHFPQSPGTYRYKVEKGKMVLDSHIQEEADGTTSKDLVGAFRWAAGKYPANKYALILWNHGVGILDPSWGKINPWQSPQKFYIEEEMLSINPRIQIDNLTFDKSLTNTMSTTIPAVSLTTENEASEEAKYLDHLIDSSYSASEILRGILFNEQSRTYMTNQDFIKALKEIKLSVLNGKKIDLLGMDACLMAMVEVGYQSRSYAKYLVASEESELAHGWDYSSLCKMLSEKHSPQNVANGIVSNYELYYKDKINFYTLSAIDLSLMDELRLNLDGVVNAMETCKQTDKNLIISAIKKARNACQQFSAPTYIDLHSFLTEFSSQINMLITTQSKNTKPYQDLKNMIKKNIIVLKQTIISSTAGKSLARAQGLSIYFPTHHIDRSYIQTEFAECSKWTSLVKEILPGTN